MPVQRALLLFLSVMLVSALAAALVRSPRPPVSTDGPLTSATAPERVEAPARTGGRRAAPEQLDVRIGEAAGDLALGRDRHVVLTVRSKEPGQVLLEGLGRVEAVATRAPAVFDLYTSRAGRFPIEFVSAGASDRERVGVLVVAQDETATKPERPRASHPPEPPAPSTR